MSFLKDLFHRKKSAESVVFIDIGATSIAGAYARYVENEMPVLLYTCRLSVELRKNEPLGRAMLRTLDILGGELLREGAPALARASGSGRSDAILVSIDTPWQEVNMRTEYFERKDPFLFTKDMAATALRETSTAPSGKVLVDESVISTILNGYETHNPYGKMVHRASVTVLASFVDGRVAKSITAALRGLYHTKKIRLFAASSLRYQAMREAFPHERNTLIFDAVGPLTSIALVHNNLLVAASEVPNVGTNEWANMIVSELSKLAGKNPLPRVIFLLANAPNMPSLQKALDAKNFSSLWLSDNPPKIIPVLASHFTGLVRQAASTPPDLQLLLMALYHRPHFASLEK